MLNTENLYNPAKLAFITHLQNLPQQKIQPQIKEKSLEEDKRSLKEEDDNREPSIENKKLSSDVISNKSSIAKKMKTAYEINVKNEKYARLQGKDIDMPEGGTVKLKTPSGESGREVSAGNKEQHTSTQTLNLRELLLKNSYSRLSFISDPAVSAPFTKEQATLASLVTGNIGPKNKYEDDDKKKKDDLQSSGEGDGETEDVKGNTGRTRTVRTGRTGRYKGKDRENKVNYFFNPLSMGESDKEEFSEYIKTRQMKTRYSANRKTSSNVFSRRASTLDPKLPPIPFKSSREQDKLKTEATDMTPSRTLQSTPQKIQQASEANHEADHVRTRAAVPEKLPLEDLKVSQKASKDYERRFSNDIKKKDTKTKENENKEVQKNRPARSLSDSSSVKPEKVQNKGIEDYNNSFNDAVKKKEVLDSKKDDMEKAKTELEQWKQFKTLDEDIKKAESEGNTEKIKTLEQQKNKLNLSLKEGETLDEKIEDLKKKATGPQDEYKAALEQADKDYQKMVDSLPENQREELKKSDDNLKKSREELLSIYNDPEKGKPKLEEYTQKIESINKDLRNLTQLKKEDIDNFYEYNNTLDTLYKERENIKQKSGEDSQDYKTKLEEIKVLEEEHNRVQKLFDTYGIDGTKSKEEAKNKVNELCDKKEGERQDIKEKRDQIETNIQQKEEKFISERRNNTLLKRQLGIEPEDPPSGLSEEERKKYDMADRMYIGDLSAGINSVEKTVEDIEARKKIATDKFITIDDLNLLRENGEIIKSASHGSPVDPSQASQEVKDKACKLYNDQANEHFNDAVCIEAKLGRVNVELADKEALKLSQEQAGGPVDESVIDEIERLKIEKSNLETSRTDSLNQAEAFREKSISLLPQDQQDNLKSMEDERDNYGTQVLEWNNRKVVEDKDYAAYVQNILTSRDELNAKKATLEKDSKEYKQIEAELDKLTKDLDTRMKEYYEFNDEYKDIQNDFIKSRQKVEELEDSYGVGLKSSETLSGGEQKKAELIDNMFVGDPSLDPIENKARQINITKELSNYSLVDLQNAATKKESGGANGTILLGNIGEMGGDPNAKAFFQENRIVLSREPMSGLITHEAGHMLWKNLSPEEQSKLEELYKKNGGKSLSIIASQSTEEYFSEGLRMYYGGDEEQKKLELKDPALFKELKDFEQKGNLKDGVLEGSEAARRQENSLINKVVNKTQEVFAFVCSKITGRPEIYTNVKAAHEAESSERKQLIAAGNSLLMQNKKVTVDDIFKEWDEKKPGEKNVEEVTGTGKDYWNPYASISGGWQNMGETAGSSNGSPAMSAPSGGGGLFGGDSNKIVNTVQTAGGSSLTGETGANPVVSTRQSPYAGAGEQTGGFSSYTSPAQHSYSNITQPQDLTSGGQVSVQENPSGSNKFLSPTQSQTFSKDFIQEAGSEKKQAVMVKEEGIISVPEEEKNTAKEDKSIIVTSEEISGGLTKEEESVGLTPEEKSAGLTKEEKTAGLTPEEKSAGLTKEEKTAGLTLEEKSAGLTKEEKIEGMTKEEKTAGLTLEEKSVGMTREEKVEGMTKEEKTLEMTKEEKTAGMTKEEKTLGMTKEEKTAGMTKEEKTVGITKEEKTAGMTKEEKTVGMTKEEKTTGMTKEEKTTGMTKEEKTAGITKEEKIVGMTKEEKTAGITKEEKTAGITKEEKTTGMTKEEKTAGMTKEEKIVGMMKEEKTAGITKEEKTTGMTKEENTTGMTKEEKTAGMTKEEKTTAMSREERTSSKTSRESGVKTEASSQQGVREQKQSTQQQGEKTSSLQSPKQQKETAQVIQSDQQWIESNQKQQSLKQQVQTGQQTGQEQVKTTSRFQSVQQQSQTVQKEVQTVQQQVQTGTVQQQIKSTQIQTGQQVQSNQQQSQTVQKEVQTVQQQVQTGQQTGQEQVKTTSRFQSVQQQSQTVQKEVQTVQQQVQTGQKQSQSESMTVKPVTSSTSDKISTLTPESKKGDVLQTDMHKSESQKEVQKDKKSISWTKTGELPEKPSLIGIPKDRVTDYKDYESSKKEILLRTEKLRQGDNTTKTFETLKKQNVSDKQSFIESISRKSNSVRAFNNFTSQLDSLPKVDMRTLKETAGQKTAKTFEALQSNTVRDIIRVAQKVTVAKEFDFLKEQTVSNRTDAIKAFHSKSFSEKIFQSLKSKPVASRELLHIKLLSVTKGAFKSLERKPVVQKNFLQLVRERTGTSLKSLELLRGNSVQVNNLQQLQARLDKINLVDKFSIYNKAIFITEEDIKDRKKQNKISNIELEQIMSWDKTKYVSTVPTEIYSDSKLQLMRLCQMCQTKVGVDIVLCPSCAALRRKMYTELKLVYREGARRNYFSGNLQEGSVKSSDQIELSLQAANMFANGNVDEIATLRKGQIFPKMKDVLALTRGDKIYTSKQMVES